MSDKKDLFIHLRNNKIDNVIKYISDNPDLDYNIKDDAGTYLIFYIITTNNTTLLDKILLTNIKIDVYDSDGRTILYAPIKYGFTDIVKSLLQYSENTVGIPIQSIMDDNGNIALHYAIMFKNMECFDLLAPISNCASVDKNGNNSLHHATMSRSLHYVEKVYQLNNYTNIQNNSGETPLHMACRMSLPDIVNYLIVHKSELNVQEYHLQSTPLHYACYSGNDKIVAMLLDNNVDVNVQDFDGNTPLHYCVMYNKIMVTHLLLNHHLSIKKINVNLFNVNLNLPLHIILDNPLDNLHTYIELLLPKTNLNFQNKFGVTCLHQLCNLTIWKKYTDVLKIKKLDIIIRDYNDMRPIDHVDERSMDKFIDMVVDSYLYILNTKGKQWPTKWENECKQLFGTNNTDGLPEILDTTKKGSLDKCKNLIKKKIIELIDMKQSKCNEKTYPVKEKSSKCIKLDFDERIMINTMIGTTLDILCGLLYLIQKHRNTKFCMEGIQIEDTSKCDFYKKNNVPGTGTFECILEKYFITWYKNMLNIDPILEKITIDNINSQNINFIVFFVRLIHRNGVGHANVLLYSKKTNEIERFDPFGSGYDNELDVKLEKYFSNIIPKVKYISPRDYMSTVGFQKIDVSESQNEYIGDPEGYCVAWSLWYVDMRITLQTITRTKLIKYIMQQIGEKHMKYRSIIRNYSRNITKIRDNILNKAELDVNQYVNGEYDIDDGEKIINEINSIIK
jgi:ankyrin repeat protein